MTCNPNFISIDETDLDIKEIDHISTHTVDSVIPPPESKKSDYVVVLVLFIINLLNYIDRFTIPGVLSEVQEYYGDLTTADTGILQTAFVITYMLCSPIFGYLGDRMSRKWIIIIGVSFWSLITLSSSFIPRNLFWLFVVMRSLVGVGEASYSTVAPTIISDIFASDRRTKVMAFFYFAVPIGSGAGYIAGYGLSKLFGLWQAALRITPIVGLACVVMLVILVREPQRGRADGGTHLAASPWSEDIRQLTKNPTFMFVTFASTAAYFVIGSVSFYAVLYLISAIKAQKMNPDADTADIQFIFGGMTILAGIIGVLVGTETGRRLKRFIPSADALVCAAGICASSPFFLVSLVLAKYHFQWSLVAIFFTQTLLCLNWALVTDMTMSVVIPSRRATATAYQMILSHALGDAGSPYIIGLIRDSFKTKLGNSISDLDADYYSMQYALFLNCVISIVGGIFFVLASLYIVKDKQCVAKVIEESKFHYETVGSSYQPEDSQIIDSSPKPRALTHQRII